MNNPVHRKRIMKCGWLKKQGGVVKTWHRRWFCLNGDCLFYFAKEDDLRPLGSIFLPGNRVSEIPYNPEDPDKYLFEVSPEDTAVKDNTGKLQSRMAPNHDSFLLCATNDTERQDWMKIIRRVMYSSFGGAIFGQSIEDTMEYEHKLNRRLPFLIEQCIKFLTEYGLEVEGIFRLPGRNILIKELKQRFDCAERIVFDISEVDVHTVASLLKLYFRELPQAIVPAEYYQKFMNIALRFQGARESTEKQKAVSDLQAAVQEIPDDNFQILSYLCKFLSKVGEHSDVNKMTVLNIATVFGPNIVRNVTEADSAELLMATADLTQQLAFMMINFVDELFIEKTKENACVPVGNLLDMDTDDHTSTLKPISLNLAESINKELQERNCSPSNEASTPTSPLDHQKTPTADNSNPTMSAGKPEKPVPPLRRNRKAVSERRREYRKTPVSSMSLDDIDIKPPAGEEEKSILVNGDEKTGEQVLQDQPVDENLTSKCVNLEEMNKQLSDDKVRLEVKMNEMKLKVERLERQIKDLNTNNSVITQRYETRISTMDTAHKHTVQRLQEKMAEEQKTREEAVSRVIILQSELQQYHLKYGHIED